MQAGSHGSSQTDQPLAFLTVACYFLRLAEGACDLLARNANRLTVVSSSPITPASYSRSTRWSDHSVGVAILFNYFHGIELLLKGFLAISGTPPGHHKLSQLLADFDKSFSTTDLGATLARVVCNTGLQSPLGQFFSANSINIDSWYEALKYPTSKKGKPFSHAKLKYGGHDTVKFWKSVGRSAASLRKQSVALARSLGHA